MYLTCISLLVTVIGLQSSAINKNFLSKTAVSDAMPFWVTAFYNNRNVLTFP